jgi:hypothetical protein
VKRLTYGSSGVLVGDRTADLVIDYAVVLVMQQAIDVVELTALSIERDEALRYRFLLGAGVPIATAGSDDERPEPDNRPAELRIREQIARLTFDPVLDPWDAVKSLREEYDS